MKKLLAILICAIICATLLSSCDEAEECVHTKGDWEHDENGHWQPIICSLNSCNLEETPIYDHIDEDENDICDVCGYQAPKHEHTGELLFGEYAHWYQYTCGCESPDIAEQHLDGDGDGKCDDCEYQMSEHQHTYEKYQDEIGHGWSYTCGCMTPPNFAQHSDGDGDEKCDDCKYDLKKEITDSNRVQTTIGEEAQLPQFMSLETEKHNALSSGATINVDVYMGYDLLNKDGAAFSDIIVPEEEFGNYTFVLEINYNNEAREIAIDGLNYFEEYRCDMYQGVVQYNKYNTIQLDTDNMTKKSYGFVNVELYMISDTNQRYWVSAQTLYYSVTETEIVFGLVSNPVANEGDIGIITKGWEYVEPSNSDINIPDTPKNLCGHTSSIQKADADLFDSGVFHAGFYNADSLTENSLNFDKLANSRLDSALVYMSNC